MDLDFRRALEAAQRAFTAEDWALLHPRDRTEAIYRELKRIDRERATSREAAPASPREPPKRAN